jgi:hypothetical protein
VSTPLRNLLFVHPRAFAKGWAGSTPRLFAVAQGLAARGWQPHLLRFGHRCTDLTLEVQQAFPGAVSVAPFGTTWRERLAGVDVLGRLGLRRRASQGQIRTYREDLAPAERAAAWCVGAGSPARPDIVWGISVGRLLPLLVASELKAAWGCPLVIEMQDPVPLPGRRLPADAEQRLATVMRNADLVITTTSTYAAELGRRYPSEAAKIRTVHLSFDDAAPRNLRAPDAHGVMLLLHAGLLHSGVGRRPLGLMTGLAEAIRREPSLGGEVMVEFLGAATGGAEVARLAQQLNLAANVSVREQVPLRESLRRMDDADVLVVIKFDGPLHDAQIPGKLFQYLGKGKPILGLLREGTEAGQILLESGLGFVAEGRDTSLVADTLIRLWRERQVGWPSLRANWPFIARFSQSAMASRVDELLHNLC